MKTEVSFLLQVATEEDAEDNGAECVICMCDLRDTLILPCRHLCLCNCCADSLRYCFSYDTIHISFHVIDKFIIFRLCIELLPLLN